MVSDLRPTNDLRGRRVFLSAGIPEDDWTDAPWQRHEIVQAVMATTRAALVAGADLLFGGHPLITPLVFDLASQLFGPNERRPRVVLFQSDYFADVLPSSVWSFREAPWAVVHNIEAAGRTPDSLEESLGVMRNAMLRSAPIAAAIFIGGKPGIRREYDLVRERFGDVPCYPLRRPGGIAAELEPVNVSESLLADLVQSAAYGHIARQIVGDIAERF